jgi:hypothetical protein
MSVDDTGAGVLSADTVIVFVFAHRATRSHDGSQSQGTPDPTRAVRSGVLSQTSAFASPQSSAPATPAIKAVAFALQLTQLPSHGRGRAIPRSRCLRFVTMST